MGPRGRHEQEEGVGAAGLPVDEGQGRIPEAPLDPIAYTLAPDAAGRVWVGTNTEPYLWDGTRFTAVVHQPWWPSSLVTMIELDRDGSVLAGGDGLFQIWPERRWERIRTARAAPRDFLRDREGTLWVAVEGGGGSHHLAVSGPHGVLSVGVGVGGRGARNRVQGSTPGSVTLSMCVAPSLA